MKVLVACEYSGVVRDAFIRHGHDATSCDLLPTESPGPHYQGDVMDILNSGWDLMVAHPECTYLCNSGVRHLHNNPARWISLYEAAVFFKTLLNADIPQICIENPIMHKYGKLMIGGVKQTQTIQPWMFGHPEKKATCLWLKGLPPLSPSKDVKQEMESMPKSQTDRIHYMSPGPERQKERSRTYKGIADAMASQWSNQIQEKAA